MKFQILDGHRIEDWRWEQYVTADGNAGMEVELYQPDLVERLEMVARYKLNSDSPNWGELVRFVSGKWWRDFRGAVDANGAPLPNTPQVRELILRTSEPLLAFVLEKFRTAAERKQEGNGGSGSA